MCVGVCVHCALGCMLCELGLECMCVASGHGHGCGLPCCMHTMCAKCLMCLMCIMCIMCICASRACWAQMRGVCVHRSANDLGCMLHKGCAIVRVCVCVCLLTMSMQAPAADTGAQDALQARLGKIEEELKKLQDKYEKQRGELQVKKREWDTLKGVNGELMIQNEAMRIVKEVRIERV
jgi:hypothetical protein